VTQEGQQQKGGNGGSKKGAIPPVLRYNGAMGRGVARHLPMAMTLAKYQPQTPPQQFCGIGIVWAVPSSRDHGRRDEGETMPPWHTNQK
jgi:hypothetical protein